MREVIGHLERLRRKTRTALIAQGGAALLAYAIMGVLGLIALDFVFRLPSAARLTLDALALVGLGYGFARLLWPVVRYHPSLTQLALRVERCLPAVSGHLASSVEFALGGADTTNDFAAKVVSDTQERLLTCDLGRSLDLRRTWRDLGILLAVLVAGVAFAVASPGAAATGLSRVFLPYGDATWPARTGVESLMDQVVPDSGVYPRGQALPLRADVTVGPLDQRVHAHYRVHTEDGWQSWQDILLTHQGEGVHERLVDTSADELEVAFSTVDDRTRTESIPLVAPPAVVRATVRIEPPAYAAERFPPIEQELGPGTDDRSVVDESALVGSSVRLDLQLNKPLEVPVRGREEWLAQTFGWSGFELIESADDRWAIAWTLERSQRLSLELEDEHGLANAEPIVYRVGAVDDHAPSVTIVEPQADLVVLPSAVVPLTGEAQDDVVVGAIGLEARLFREGEIVEDTDWSIENAVGAPSATIDHDLDLARFSLQEGDQVLVQGTASDTFESGDERHDVARSSIRRLRVISELEFATQLRRQLSAVRQNAIRIEALQSELQDDVIDHGPQPGADRAQAQIAERIADQREALEAIEQQVGTNRFDDEQLEDLLGQSEDLLDFAGRAASQASEAIDQRRREGGGGSSPGEQTDPNAPREADAEDQGIVDSQQTVRDELTDLIELLDRDEDTWVVTRQLESLLDRLERLQAETEQLNRETVGRDVSDLDDETRAELDRLAETSREIADESRQLTDDLPRRAEAMQDADPDAASGMRAAASAAEQHELDRDLQQAEENIESNRLANAMTAEQAAQQTMQRMLEEIERAHRAHTQQLLRRLASLIESIDRLIAVQENELLALAAAVANASFDGRDRAMIRLSQNTQAVASEARAAGQEARRIARTLDRGADAQGAAVGALRAEPVDAAGAEDAETRALERLREAKALAEEMEEAAQDEELRRRREELIAAYRAFAEQQAGVREAALGLSDIDELNRRQLVEARRLATSQDEIATGLEDLRRSNSELAQARVFSLVHSNIERWSASASGGLREGKVDVDVTDPQQRILRSIGRLIEALEEATAPPEEFAGQQGGEAAGSGGQGAQPPLIPPASELRLMHGVQEGIYEQTRGMDDREDLSTPQRRERLRELGEQQRDLLDLGQQFLEELQSGGQPPMAPAGEPDAEGGDAPVNFLPTDEKPQSTQRARRTSRHSDIAVFRGSDARRYDQGGAVEVLGASVFSVCSVVSPLPWSPQETQPDKQDQKERQESEGETEDEKKDDPPSLDDLLGLDPDEQGASARDVAERRTEEELSRRLTEEQAADAFVAALREMEVSADLLDEDFDTGLGTQRVQEDILAKLDQLIDFARQQQSSSSSSSSSSARSQQSQQSPGRQERNEQTTPGDENNQKANQGQETEPPGGQEPNPGSITLEGSGTEWGNLPPRVRDELVQGRRDKYSNIYDYLTREYYRRLAEGGSQ